MPSPLIDRRQFLAGALAAGAIGATHLHPRAVRGHSTQARLSADVTSASAPSILVLCTLYGGNDGLTTVIPYGNSAYYQTRGAVAIPAASVLQIGQGIGLHPSLSGMKTLFDAGQVAIVQGIGYPNPNYSHFESMDIWQSGDPSGDVSTGWIGRWLDRSPAEALNALWLGPNLPLAFVGKTVQASAIMPSSSPSAQVPAGSAELRNFYALLQRAHRYDSKLERVAQVSATNMLSVSEVVSETLSHAPSVAANFPATAASFGTQMGVVAQLIAAGLPTQVYGVSLNGFDSHAGEVASYATLLKELDSGVSGFFKALSGVPQGANTVLVIYTEFGRRVAANASGGTDHGSGNVAFVIGPSVKGGLYGEQSSLTQLDANGSLLVSTDYRSLYTTIFDQVLHFDPGAVLSGQFPTIPMF